MADNEKVDQQSPYVLAMIIADSIYVDPSSGKKTLLGLFSAIFTTVLPARIGQVALYVAMTDGRGKTPLRIVFVDADEENPPIFEAQAEFEFTDPRMVAELMMSMNNLEFPAAGEYRLQLWCSQELLIERRIVVSLPPESRDA